MEAKYSDTVLSECLALCNQKKKYDKYVAIFDQMQISDTDLKKLYIEHNATTTIAGNNSIQVSCNEDVWILENTNKKGCVKLFHNDYKKTFDGEQRWFTGGFHDQFPYIKNLSVAQAIDSVVNYVWNGHPQDVAYLIRKIKKKHVAI